MQRYENQTVIVTGGGGGIGSATCRRLAAEGAKVAVFDQDVLAVEDVLDADYGAVQVTKGVIRFLLHGVPSLIRH